VPASGAIPQAASPVALDLPESPQGRVVALPAEWRTARLTASEESGAATPPWEPAFDDAAWRSVTMPYLGKATDHGQAVWYRVAFDVPAPDSVDGHWLVWFGGAFYDTEVWLNGRPLGHHTGYFAPFGFDVQGVLRQADNVLAVRCETPMAAGDFRSKTAVLGIFADWDCKPYPSSAYPSLHPDYEWTVPVGLWRPARLEAIGPVLVEALTVLAFPEGPDAAATGASVTARAVLRNLDREARQPSVRLDLEPLGFDAPGASVHETLRLTGGEQRELLLETTLPQARPWRPWTHGQPSRYSATLEVVVNGVKSKVRVPFGVRDLTVRAHHETWEWRLAGQRIFPRGSNYISDLSLDLVSSASLRRDLELARAANLDLLRVHAHIGPRELYELCDEFGIMVMCDFPMQWTHGYDLEPEAEEAHVRSAAAQAQTMARLLASHPSIAMWSLHNEPPWTPAGSFLGADVHETATNRDLDEALVRSVTEVDPTRLALPASGVFDQHLYHGWYTGSWQDNQHLRPAFPTEFGVQALPSLDSPFWSTVNTDWPVAADDPSWAHAGYQALFWASPGIGPPDRYRTLAEYVEESQAYQAFFIRHVIDQWRRLKFQPVGGYVHFLLTDGWPGITWSVLDYVRLPKAGYHALAEASAPTAVAIELVPGILSDPGFRLRFPEGERVTLRLWVVNDDFAVDGTGWLRWWVEPAGHGLRRRGVRRLSRLTAATRVVQLPRADEPAVPASEVHLSLRRGAYDFRVELEVGGVTVNRNALTLHMGADLVESHAARHVPGFLVRRVYVRGSLRHTGDGLTFRLRNPAMPVSLEGVRRLELDGQPIDLAEVKVAIGGSTRRLHGITPQTPLEVPSGESLNVVVPVRLGPGPHTLELTARFEGLGEVTAKFRDELL
jgi:beta-mannosidase